MPEETPQQQPTLNQKSVSWKRILIVAVIAAVVIGLGVLIFFILQPKPETTSTVTTKKATPSAKISTPSAKKDETADWKTYTNSVLKFSIKYPEEVEETFDPEYSLTTNVEFSLVLKKETYGSLFEDGIYLSLTIINDLDPLIPVNRIEESYTELSIETMIESKKIGSSVPATILNVSGGIDNLYRNVYAFVKLRNGKILNIHIAWTEANKDKYDKFSGQILSTFKFLE